MTSFTKSMFDSIKESLENQKGSSSFKDILKTEPGNSYIVRIIPNIKDPDKTFYHHYSHGWTSQATSQYTSIICPQTYGERCAICEERLKLYKEDTEESKAKARDLKRKENWLVNVYVVEDPKKPENNGKIKIFKYGKQIDKIVNDAIKGEDAAEFGSAIFDFSENGCNLRIKVEKNEGDYPTYVSSKFLSKDMSKKGMENIVGKAEEIYNGIFQLDKLFTLSDYEDTKELLEEHMGKSKGEPKQEKKQTPKDDTTEQLNKSTDTKVETKPETPVETKTEVKTSETKPSELDSKINDILKDL